MMHLEIIASLFKTLYWYNGIEIKNSIEQLDKGGLLLYPTDTIWGVVVI